MTGYDAENRRLLCVQRNKFAVGQPLELVLPLQGVRTFTPEKLYDAEGLPVDCVPHAAAPFMMDYPEPLPEGSPAADGRWNNSPKEGTKCRCGS